MRDIKFRAWKPDEKRMEQVGALDWNSKFKVVTCNLHSDKWYRGFDKDFDFVLMQCIGHTDKNGIDIYEGDIVRDEKGVGEVKWIKEHCAFVIRTLAPHKYNSINSDGSLSKTEVVGNIYENPELLQQN